MISLFSIMKRRVADKRPPDFVIFQNGITYMRRWWVIPRNKWFNIYLHELLHSDDPRALHDHPWVNMSLLLEGEYDEITIAKGGINVRSRLKAGQLRFRRSVTAHRLELVDGKPCWSLFVTGPVLRTWGFHCKHGWRPWREFVKIVPGGDHEIGRGCEGLD